ncbi:TPA: response regulator [Pseudomonas putida]|nr:response regulator [Pseudomonas putida]
MKVLVVEDEIPKRESIAEVITNIGFECSIDFAMSVRSAIKLLRDENFDFIVLDMSLPTFDVTEDEFGGRPQGFGGVEVIRYLEREEVVIPIAVVTAYEAFSIAGESDGSSVDKEVTLAELSEDLRNEFFAYDISVIKYDTVVDDWKNLLSSVINNLKRDSD